MKTMRIEFNENTVDLHEVAEILKGVKHINEYNVYLIKDTQWLLEAERALWVNDIIDYTVKTIVI